jgi:predicted PurR-regulated permease PerM
MTTPAEHDNAQHEIAQFLRRLQWVALGLGVCWLLWLLAPVLTPFVCAALLGWLGDPLVAWLQGKGRSRNTAVVLVFAAMVLVVLLALLILAPVIHSQINTLVNSWPRYRDWLAVTALPWLEQRSGLQLRAWLDMDSVIDFMRGHWQSASSVAGSVLGYVSRSGFAMFGRVANVVLIPILTFYFLRDWDLLVARVQLMVPRNHVDTVNRLARESGDVLGAFLRGQLMVMIALGLLYGFGLWAVGLDLGILIGVVAGLLTFVPYLGPASGVTMGVLAALIQYNGDWKHVIGVLAVFGVGQVAESYWLTPRLVGDRIGLHPVAVIFAVLAGGQLFGFLGMLLALPLAAVTNVLLRYAHERYTQSELYGGHSVIAPDVVVDENANDNRTNDDAVEHL